jgi:hypothetical protein
MKGQAGVWLDSLSQEVCMKLDSGLKYWITHLRERFAMNASLAMAEADKLTHRFSKIFPRISEAILFLDELYKQA